LQCPARNAEFLSERANMTTAAHSRRDVLASGATPAGLDLFGTAGLSGVSAFATARTQSPATARLISHLTLREAGLRHETIKYFHRKEI
jgi:hypothetical protein